MHLQNYFGETARPDRFLKLLRSVEKKKFKNLNVEKKFESRHCEAHYKDFVREHGLWQSDFYKC
jgi:hypothetical protein